jgi:hypothetical protein
MLIEFLMQQEVDRTLFLEEILWRSSGNEFRNCLRKEGLKNLLLAIRCLNEIQNRSTIWEVERALLESVRDEIENEGIDADLHQSKSPKYSLTSEAADILLLTVSITWKDNIEVLSWLKDSLLCRKLSHIPPAAVRAISRGWKDNPATLKVLHEIIKRIRPSSPPMDHVAVRELVRNWKNHPTTLILLKEIAQNPKIPMLQQAAIRELAREWKEDNDTLYLLKQCIQSEDYHFGVRSEAITEIANGWACVPGVFELLCDRAVNDPFAREHESNRNPRLRALQALFTHYSNHPKTIELLHSSSRGDNAPQI